MLPQPGARCSAVFNQLLRSCRVVRECLFPTGPAVGRWWGWEELPAEQRGSQSKPVPSQPCTPVLQVAPRRLRRSPSWSSLHEVITSKQGGGMACGGVGREDGGSFVFMLKVRSAWARLKLKLLWAGVCSYTRGGF